MPTCPANIQETKIAFGFKSQATLATANPLIDLWCLTKTNPALATINPIMETDAQDIGKGDEFPTQTFPTSIDTSVPVEKYVSSEFMAWLFSFATGTPTKTAAGTGWKYSSVPGDPTVQCLNLPAFTYAEQIRTSPNSVIDRAVVGCVVNDFTLRISSGPGRANATVSANFVGSGKVVNPSTYTPWPVPTVEHFLNAASAVITINGIDYVAQQSFISLEFTYNNNVRLDSGYYPGSGVQSGFAIRGRMEYGTREIGLTFVARAAVGSPEFVSLLAQTDGTVSVKLVGPVIGAGPSTHEMLITMPKTRITAVVNGEEDGIVTVNCTVTPLKPAGATPIVTMSATNEFAGLTAPTSELAASGAEREAA